MNDTKILQAVLDNQLKLQKQLEIGFKEVNGRLDTIGRDVAQLQDDAPTMEDHDILVKRVQKLEKRVFSTS